MLLCLELKDQTELWPDFLNNSKAVLVEATKGDFIDVFLLVQPADPLYSCLLEVLDSILFQLHIFVLHLLLNECSNVVSRWKDTLNQIHCLKPYFFKMLFNFLARKFYFSLLFLLDVFICPHCDKLASLFLTEQLKMLHDQVVIFIDASLLEVSFVAG